MKNIKTKFKSIPLFRISSFFVSKAKTPLSRFNILVICILMVSIGINYGTYLLDIADKNVLIGKYNEKFVESVSIKNFRQELTDEEMNLDFDGDGIANGEELEQNSLIYRSDSDTDGISDKADTQYQDSSFSINYKNIYNDLGLETSDNEKQIKEILDVDSVDLYSEDYNAFAIKYDGVAFDGLKTLCNPFRIMNYIGDIVIKSKDIENYLKKIYESNNSDKHLLIVSYDLSGDKYEVLLDCHPYYEQEELAFSVPDNNPIAIIEYNSDENFNTSYSLRYTIACNRMESKTFYMAKVNNGETYNYLLFSADSRVKLSDDEQILKDIRGITGNVKILSSGINQQLQNKLKFDEEYENLSNKDKILDSIIISNKNVESIGEIKGNEFLDVIKEKNNYGKIETSSNGYLENHTTKFKVSENDFGFGNFSTEANKQGVGLAMADVASNYYNYKTLPQTSTSETVQGLFFAQGLNNPQYVTQTELDDNMYKFDLNEPNIMQMLDEHNSNILSSTYLTRSSKHANNKHCLDNVIKEIDNNKTVVAYMNNGVKVTSVVIYNIKRDAIDPLKYSFYVYDPNYPGGNISHIDESTGEIKNIKTDNCIKVELKPYPSVDVEKNTVKVSYKMVFEYGNSFDYYFGNSNDFHDGLLYSGGDIAFKQPVDLSVDSSTTFI